MNVILDEFPNALEISGSIYAIHGDFRAWLQLIRILDKPKDQITAEDVRRALEYVFIEFPITEDIEDVMDEVTAFIKNEKIDEYNDEPLKMADVAEPERAEKVIDYDFDAEYIYSAFMEAYNINLRTAELHWIEFMALFNGLPKTCALMEIIGYRSVSNSTYSKMSKDEKLHIRNMKRIYALPDYRTQEEIDADFANSF